MILEKIAIDFRCQGCHSIRRTDADLHRKVLDQLPSGWVMENLGVSCARCARGFVPTAKETADQKREEVGKLRMQTADVTVLESPTTTAASPLTNDKCTRCKRTIGEMESWRPDTLATGFAKAHRQCLDNAMFGVPTT